MIRSEDVYLITLELLKKDVRGQGMNIDAFNSISALVNMELYNSYVSKYEGSATVSDIMAPFKVRDTTITLAAGKARLPGVYDRLAGNPTIAYPWGVVTATATVTIVNNPTAKLKITSPNHNLRDGDIVTVTGISVHTVTAQAVHVIDENNFWVNVTYAGADVLTAAAWTLSGAERKQVDMVTELEYSARVGDAALKPTIANPIAVLDGNVTGSITAFANGGAGVVIATSTAHGLTSGMTVVISGSSVAAYNGTYPITVTGTGTFTFAGTWSATGTATWTCTELSQITVYPSTLISVVVNYLKFPPVPLLDYYVASTGIITFLAEGAKQVNVPAGAVYRTGTVGGAAVYVDSATLNWGWDKDVLPHIIYSILQKEGLNIADMNTINLAIAKETKEEAEV
jgi:DNA/RNA endonuclease YhcR with UshA esterase domain